MKPKAALWAGIVVIVVVAVSALVYDSRIRAVRTAASIDLTQTYAVSTGVDDAEEDGADGNAITDFPALTLGNRRNSKIVGLRFQNVALARGADIANAQLALTSSGVLDPNPGIRIAAFGHAADDCAIFDATPGNLSLRALTHSTAHLELPNPIRLDQQFIFTVTDLIREIVERAGWQSGNSICFILKDSNSVAHTQGWTEIYSYENNPAKAAQLTITIGAINTPAAASAASNP